MQTIKLFVQCPVNEGEKKKNKEKRHGISIAGPDRLTFLIRLVSRRLASSAALFTSAVLLPLTACIRNKKRKIQASSSVILVDIQGTFKN